MLLVIFGAGASYDCGMPVQPLRIPLAADLVASTFGGIAMDIPASRPIVDRLRYRMTGDAQALSNLNLLCSRSSPTARRSGDSSSARAGILRS
jgi:hypothetical protein